MHLKSFSPKPRATAIDSNAKVVFALYRQNLAQQIVSEYTPMITYRHSQQTLKRLCGEHPFISINPDMLGGVPHLKGFRLSVGDVLAKLYSYGSTEKVLNVYPELSEEHVKESIAFAQDFLEEMSVPT